MIRVGIGYDVHRWTEGRRLVLGGVTIPCDRGLDGHSDADVVLHAIVDAMLGAAALGDIGTHFPDTDPRYRGADSLGLLKQAAERVSDAGYVVVNVDVSVAIESPRLSGHVAAMRQAIGEALGLPPTDISVKATTNERMGFVGREEGVAAWAVCTIRTTETYM